MSNLQSKNDIEKISFDLLKQSKSLGVFPTPVDQIVKHSDLIISNDTCLTHVDESFLEKTSIQLHKFLDKIRGFLDRKEKIIYLDLSQTVNRQKFVKLHETGHNVLPWQQQLMQFMDNDMTLDPETEEVFEAEANYFASQTLFQHDHFDTQIQKLPLSLDTVIHLSKFYGASIHATFRRYVERSTKRCSLLILQNISSEGENPECEFRNYYQSNSFSREFGQLNWNNKLGYKWNFVRDYYHGKRYKTNGKINLPKLESEFEYHFFNNSYNAFILFFPKGEKVKTRTKFIMNEI